MTTKCPARPSRVRPPSHPESPCRPPPHEHGHVRTAGHPGAPPDLRLPALAQ